MNYKALAAFFLSVTCLSAQAEQRWFEVELLLFQRNVEIEDMSEQLPTLDISVNTDDSINLLIANKPSDCADPNSCFSEKNPTVIDSEHFNYKDNGFIKLGSSSLQLIKQRQMLSAHAGFKPIFHMAWRMPVANGRRATPIHLFAGENFAEKIQQLKLEKNADKADEVIDNVEFDTNSSDSIITTDNVGQTITNQDFSTTQNTALQINASSDELSVIHPVIADKWALDGNFQVYLDHYLYIDSQLILRKEVTEQVPVTQQPIDVIDDGNDVQIATHLNDDIKQKVKQQTVIKEVLFDQNRRLRSEEIHYLDHPLMGMIVQIRKIPEAELQSAEE